MKISTHITLSQKDLQAAIEQYVNVYGVNTEGMNITFINDLPENLTVIVNESADEKDQVTSIDPDSKLADYAEYQESLISPVSDKDVNSELSGTSKPFNPFADFREQTKPIDEAREIQKPKVKHTNEGGLLNPRPFVRDSIFR